MKAKEGLLMRRLIINISVVFILSLGLMSSLLWLFGGQSPPVYAQGNDGVSIYYVAPSCGGVPAPCYTSVQDAVDATDDPGDLIKVAAGTYTGINNRGGLWYT